MRSILALAVVAVIAGTRAGADPLGLIAECEKISTDGGDTTEVATALIALSGIDLEPSDRFRGMKCLSDHFGEKYYFDLERNGFISETDEALRAAPSKGAFDDMVREKEKGEALQKSRKDELKRRLIAACYETLERDQLRAVTTPECRDLFLAEGFTATSVTP